MNTVQVAIIGAALGTTVTLTAVIMRVRDARLLAREVYSLVGVFCACATALLLTGEVRLPGGASVSPLTVSLAMIVTFVLVVGVISTVRGLRSGAPRGVLIRKRDGSSFEWPKR